MIQIMAWRLKHHHQRIPPLKIIIPTTWDFNWVCHHSGWLQVYKTSSWHVQKTKRNQPLSWAQYCREVRQHQARSAVSPWVKLWDHQKLFKTKKYLMPPFYRWDTPPKAWDWQTSQDIGGRMCDRKEAALAESICSKSNLHFNDV